MSARHCAILLRLSDIDFEKVALNPKLTHEEKIRLLVQMSHIWTDGKIFFVDEVSTDVLQAEIPLLRPEIEKRLAVSA